MKLHEIISVLEEIAPPGLADESDAGKIGLILDRKNNIKKVAVALDPTDHVLEEAARQEADLLVTHHTLIYDPVNKISKTLSDSLKIALENEISIYVMHTNYDKVRGGVNDVLSEILGLQNIRHLEIGNIGEVKNYGTYDFAMFIKERLGTNVTFAGDNDINTVMVLAGSGFKKNYLDIAIENGADAFISGDLRHEAIRYCKNISLIDATHYATENPAMLRLCERLPIDTIFIDDMPIIKVV